MEQIRLDIIPKGLMPVCHSSQYDKGRVIRLNLVDGLQGYTLSDETVTLNVRKPDNNIVTAGVNVVSGASYVDIVTTEQMTACEGENLCEIVITKGDVKIASLNFKMKVEVDPLKDGIESETVIHNLETTISDMVKEEIEAISPEEELSGAMASFETHEIAPLVDCKVKIEAIQSGSGTPSPDNVRPITGFTGANIKVAGSNLWNEDWELGNISTSDGQPSTSTLYICSKVYCACKGGATYYCKSHSTSQLVIYWYSANDTYLGFDVCTNTTKTAPANAVKFKIRCEVTTYSNDISINYPATDTAYHAYNANSTTTAITWQSEAGTVYGGSLDVTTGVLTITHYYWTDDGTKDWRKNPDGSFYCRMNTPSAVHEATGACNYAPYVISFDGLNVFARSNGLISLGKDWGNIYADVTALKSAFAITPLQVVYPLATPITVQLTPTEINTILGVNNIWADTGDIDVVYHHELTARYVYFDNTGTDLTATNVEAAIKELWSRLQ